MENSIDIVAAEEMSAINIRISKSDKEKIQALADKNSNGRITKLIKMLANGTEIKR